MINQEINLYQDRFKEKKIWLSANHFGFLLGLILVLLLASSYWYNNQLERVKLQHQNLLSSKENITRVVKAQQQELNSLLANSKLDDEIAAISSKISARKRIIQFVSTNQLGPAKGFSSALKGLSEISVKNVWLNEITLEEDNIRLAGSALQAEKIPEYFHLFQQHTLFEGKLFENFELNRKTGEDWKIDFLIASRTDLNE